MGIGVGSTLKSKFTIYATALPEKTWEIIFTRKRICI